jgi:hypothetical protein
MNKILPSALLGFTLVINQGAVIQEKYDDYQSCSDAMKFAYESYKNDQPKWMHWSYGTCIPDQKEVNDLRLKGVIK